MAEINHSGIVGNFVAWRVLAGDDGTTVDRKTLAVEERMLLP